MSKHQDWDNGTFDKLIKQAVEDQPVSFDSSAWELMEKKLDAHKPVGKGLFSKSGRIGGMIVLLLLSSLSGWYVLSKHESQPEMQDLVKVQENVQQVPQIDVQQVPQEVQTLPEEKGAERAEALTLESKQNSGQEELKQQAENRSGKVNHEQATSGAMADGDNTAENDQMPVKADPLQDHQKKQAADQVVEQNSSISGQSRKAFVNAGREEESISAAEKNNSHTKSPETAMVPPESEGELILEDLLGSSVQPQADEKLTLDSSVSTETSLALVNDTHEQQLIQKSSNERGLSLPTIQERTWIAPQLAAVKPELPAVQTTKAENALTAEEKEVPLARKMQALQPLSISLTVAPDFTSLLEAGGSKFGAGAGLHLEYLFLKKLSVITGAFYSKKNYLVDNSFSPYGQPWDYGRKPDYIDASCGVIDIPLNIRYYYHNGSRHKLFISAGASSYLMKSEDYEMVYSNSYYGNYTYSIRGENKHFMAMYNLSLGYEHTISKQWSLQAEPFIKIPAQGVGVGSVKLKTVGVFMHLKYNFMR